MIPNAGPGAARATPARRWRSIPLWSRLGTRTRLAVAGGAAIVVLAGASLLAFELMAPRPVAHKSGHGPVAAHPQAASSPTPLPLARGAFKPVRLVIQRIGVTAPVEVKDVDHPPGDKGPGTMQSPDKASEVAWYDFTAQPGAGGNAVFAGHKDYYGVPQAIFYHLGDLKAGDVIEVQSDQQTELRYQVTASWDYTLSQIPMANVLETVKHDEITLITCAGTYQGRQTGYDHRLVVRAALIT